MALSQFHSPARLARDGTVAVSGDLVLPQAALQDTVRVSFVLNQGGRVARGIGELDGSTDRWSGVASGARLSAGPALATGMLVAASAEGEVAGLATFSWSVNIEIEAADGAEDAEPRSSTAAPRTSAYADAPARADEVTQVRHTGYASGHGNPTIARLHSAEPRGEGRYDRLFPGLPPFAADTPAVRQALLTLGEEGGEMDAGNPWRAGAANGAGPGERPPDAGWTYFGQFVDHDVTFDPTSSLERQVDPSAIVNYRTPALELDSLYGAGPAASPQLYDENVPGRLLLDRDAPDDVPRNSQFTAIVGDPRNDANLIVSQLHVAFIKFHNAVLDRVFETTDDAFWTAQRLVRWHYQWIVVHGYLPAVVGEDVVADVLTSGRRFYRETDHPFVPVEMSAAAFRFGHSQVQPGYRVNLAGDGGKPFEGPILDPATTPDDEDPRDLSGGRRAPRRFVDWPLFFTLTPEVAAQPCRPIATKLSSPLFWLKPTPADLLSDPPLHSLAQRNLLRHLTFGLPSGERVAEAMAVRPLTSDELPEIARLPAEIQTPLWFYILREAQLRHDGRRLGDVGGRILAEVLIGLVQGDSDSYLAHDPAWRPEPPVSDNREFTIADLLRFAGAQERAAA